MLHFEPAEWHIINLWNHAHNITVSMTVDVNASLSLSHSLLLSNYSTTKLDHSPVKVNPDLALQLDTNAHWEKFTILLKINWNQEKIKFSSMWKKSYSNDFLVVHHKKKFSINTKSFFFFFNCRINTNIFFLLYII